METRLIEELKARVIYDSRSAPTLEVDVVPGGRASSPSGAPEVPIAKYLAGREQEFKALKNAVEIITDAIALIVKGHEATDQSAIDTLLQDFRRSRPPGEFPWERVTLAVSLAVGRAGAKILGIEFFEHIAQLSGTPIWESLALPAPMMNAINGGVVGSDTLAFQAFMIVPIRESFAESVRAGCLSRTERCAKYNQLLRIEDSENMVYAGWDAPYDFTSTRIPQLNLCVNLVHKIRQKFNDLSWAILTAPRLRAAGTLSICINHDHGT